MNTERLPDGRWAAQITIRGIRAIGYGATEADAVRQVRRVADALGWINEEEREASEC